MTQNISTPDRDYALVVEGALQYGFGGTKCVQYALQVMGIDVCGIIPFDYILSFLYEHYISKKYTVEDLDRIYSTLKANGLHKKFSHVITGYIETPEMLNKLAEIVTDMKASNPDIIYLCDPVLGDNENAYPTITADIRSTYRDILIPMADITTPNQYEVQILSGMEIHTEEDALKAIQSIHTKGPDIVIMSSSTIESKDVFTTIGSRWKDGKREAYRIDFPRIDVILIGCGDLFAGSFTGLLRKTGDFKSSFEKAISILQIVCQRTYREAKETAGPGNKITPDLLELRVAQCTSFILNPQIVYPSTKLL